MQEWKELSNPFPFFVSEIINIQSISQLLEEIAISDSEMKIISNKQVKIQPKSSIVYVNIVKELKNRNTEFYTYKLKQERSFKGFLKHIHSSINVDVIRKN